jgi:hypothetical protein
MIEPYVHSPTRLRDFVLNYLSAVTNLHFFFIWRYNPNSGFCFYYWGGTYVTRYCGHFWPIVQPQMIDEGDCGAIGGTWPTSMKISVSRQFTRP